MGQLDSYILLEGRGMADCVTSGRAYNAHKDGLQGPRLVFGERFSLPLQSCQTAPQHSGSFSVRTQPPGKAGSALVPPTLFPPIEFLNSCRFPFPGLPASCSAAPLGAHRLSLRPTTHQTSDRGHSSRRTVAAS